MKACVIVPVYNHEQAIPEVVARLKEQGLFCLLVNDGSSEACSKALGAIAEREAGWLALINRPENGGKGAAMVDGFNEAIRRGFTHALQIDADGQHDIDAIPEFLAAGRRQPDAMILGRPVFDDSAPRARLYGRRFTNLWIAINTLSLVIADGMCGFRLYPLEAVERLLETARIGRRMDFDIDIAVRLYWQGTNAVNVPTRVRYPYDGVSHFKLWRDNAMISMIHARLFLGMLMRFPQLLIRRWR